MTSHPLIDLPPFPLEKMVLFPSQLSAQPKPLINPEAISRYHNDRHAEVFGQIPSLGIYTLNNVLVGPHGTILSHDGKIYSALDVLGSKYVRDTILKRIQTADVNDALISALNGKAEVITIPGEDPVVIVNKPGVQVYGHWLLDILPTLWLFIETSSKHGVDMDKVRYLLPTQAPSWARTMLKLLFNLPADKIFYYNEGKSVVKVARAILPSQLRINNYISPHLEGFVQSIINWADFSGPVSNKTKLYITRRNIQFSFVNRSIKNAEQLEEIAVKKGFEIVDPAPLSWIEQVRLFMGAKAVVGPFGSGLHNTLFSPAGTVSLSLASIYMNWLQSGISAFRGQKMSYLFPLEEHVRENRPEAVFEPVAFGNALDNLLNHIN
jgi:hypothetical protein